MSSSTVELNELQPQDPGSVRREKINANFALLLGLRDLDEPIQAINQSIETELIGRDRIGPLAVTDDDILAPLAWTSVNKAGSSIADLATRSAGDLTSGTLGVARLPTEAARKDQANLFTPSTQSFGTAIGAIDVATLIAFFVTSATNKPGIRYRGTGAGTGLWELSNDGTTWAAIGAVGGGGGLSTLNGQNGASQTFGNDTNVTISSLTNVHTLVWSGTLAVARGGSGAGTAAGARSNLGVPGLGDNNVYTKRNDFAKGADLASAAALTLGVDGNYFVVTGSTQITSIAAAPAGTEIWLEFAGALNIVHSAALVMYSGQTFTTEAGDMIKFVSKGSGNWRQSGYTPAARFRPSGAVRLDMHTNARLVLPVGANKFAT